MKFGKTTDFSIRELAWKALLLCRLWQYHDNLERQSSRKLSSSNWDLFSVPESKQHTQTIASTHWYVLACLREALTGCCALCIQLVARQIGSRSAAWSFTTALWSDIELSLSRFEVLLMLKRFPENSNCERFCENLTSPILWWRIVNSWQSPLLLQCPLAWRSRRWRWTR